MAETIADSAGHRTPGRAGFVDHSIEATATHLLGGAFTYEQAETRRAARYTARQAPDLLDVLGLTAPPRPTAILDRFGNDCLTDLLNALAAGGERDVLDGMNRVERQAARRALAARLEDR